MRVVTTCNKQGLEDYGYRWLESRKNWPKADFQFYTEGFEVDCPGKDFKDLPDFSAWKLKHARYRAPSWRYEVVRYAHKVFAAIDALYDYKGLGVWLDADCVTYKKIPKGFLEKKLDGAYIAHYGRAGMNTETGFWMVDCSHPLHQKFLDTWKSLYLEDRFKGLSAWTDCQSIDAAIRLTGVPTTNLSGEFVKDMHPMAKTELGRYIDHCKGPRKALGRSPENRFRGAA